MKATITSTTEVVRHVSPSNMCRVWEGVTEAGVPFTAYVAMVQVGKDADNSQFERDLMQHKEPEPATRRAIDMRMVI